MKDDRLYTIAEASEILGCSKNLIYDLINNGLIRGLKLGRLKIRKATLEEFMEKYDGQDLSDFGNIHPYSPDQEAAS
ncbi:helix-turn-helix domain-containing protein [Eubacterium limosum]|uniref:helix-turn-helix domain-containing protein n=1 Tax=Eubacterium TaxID=1730 RepID=UPI001D060346|nr:helix-turn-helix domain-containing protein [Eubacterium limosum]MCB6572374.1 helix-turn-helix domain-containing protein [Eubacterium limosum]